MDTESKTDDIVTALLEKLMKKKKQELQKIFDSR